MIVLEDVTLEGPGGVLLDCANIALPSDQRIALLGNSEGDKELFLDVLAGALLPSSGRIVRDARLSFPVGQLPGFSKDLTVRVNIAHVARLYGADVRETLEIVGEAFSLSEFLDRPYLKLPREMRKPLSQIVAFALPFDTYLLTDQRQYVAAGKHRSANREHNSNQVFEVLFEYRMRTAGIIVPTNDLAFVREHCNMAIALDRGRLEWVEDIEGINRQCGRRRNRRAHQSGQDRVAARRKRLGRSDGEREDS